MMPTYHLTVHLQTPRGTVLECGTELKRSDNVTVNRAIEQLENQYGCEYLRHELKTNGPDVKAVAPVVATAVPRSNPPPWWRNTKYFTDTDVTYTVVPVREKGHATST